MFTSAPIDCSSAILVALSFLSLPPLILIQEGILFYIPLSDLNAGQLKANNMLTEEHIRCELKLMEPRMIPVTGTVNGMRLILPALAYPILNDKKSLVNLGFSFRYLSLKHYSIYDRPSLSQQLIDHLHNSHFGSIITQ